MAHNAYRKTGEPRTRYTAADGTPICSLHAIDLKQKEAEQRGKMSDFTDWDAWRATIEQNGSGCEKYFTWHEGLSFKDHFELMNLERQEQLHLKTVRDNRYWNLICALAGAIVGALAGAIARWTG